MRAHVILVLRAMAAAPLAGMAVALNGLSLGANHLARMILGRVTHVPLADYQALAERFDKLSAECERHIVQASVKADVKRRGRK